MKKIITLSVMSLMLLATPNTVVASSDSQSQPEAKKQNKHKHGGEGKPGEGKPGDKHNHKKDKASESASDSPPASKK